MANKYKLNPITGKFDIIGDGEGGGMTVTSSDNTIDVTETAEGVDLGVNVNGGQLKTEFDTLHEIYNKYKRRPSGNIDTEGIEKHWIFPQDVRLNGGVNLQMPSGSSQYGDWLLVAICTSGNNGSVDTEGKITLNSCSTGSYIDPQLDTSVQFPLLDFRWRLLRGENSTEPDNGVPPQLFVSDLTYKPTEYKESKGQSPSASAPIWSFDPNLDFMCVCHKVTQAEYGVSKFSSNAGYSYVYFVFIRHKIWHCFYTSLEFNRIVTGSPIQCTYWTNNYHYNAAMGSPATATWNNVMKSPSWAYSATTGTDLSHWCQYCDRSDNRGQFRDILCQTLFGETAGNGVTALPTGTRVMAQVSTPQATGMTQSADNATDAAFHNLVEHLELADPKLWEQKTWSGFTSVYGFNVWTDGTDIYYSYGENQYVLDKSTSTWSVKTWNGLSSFPGNGVWSDGTDIYYSYERNQYVLDKSTSTWSVKTWNGLDSFSRSGVWSDGTDIYYSNRSEQFVLDKSTSTWSVKTWNGLSSFYGNSVWSDGTDIYYSYGATQYVLDKSTFTWSVKTWNGLDSFIGEFVWTDDTDVYYSNGEDQYVLDRSNSTWSLKTWDGLDSFFRDIIWTDGTNTYASFLDTQLVLNPTISSDSEFAFRRSASDTWQKIKMADIVAKIKKDIAPIITLTGEIFYLNLYPKKATFIFNATGYDTIFYLQNAESYTESIPFRAFGQLSNNEGTLFFNEIGGSSIATYSVGASSLDPTEPCMYEFWLDEGVPQLRVTQYPNGYDGNPGISVDL